MDSDTQMDQATGDDIDQIVASMSPEPEAEVVEDVAPEAQQTDDTGQDTGGDADHAAQTDTADASDQAVDESGREPEPEPQADPEPEASQSIFDKLSEDEIRERVEKYESLEQQHQKLVSSMGRSQQQFGETRKQLEELQRQVQEREERERESAEKQQLSPYNRKHPDFQRFQALQQRAREDRETLSRVQDPDVRAQLEQAIDAKYTEDEQQLLMGYQGYIEDQLSQFGSGPQDFIMEVVEQYVPSLIQQQMQAMQEYNTLQQQTSQYVEKHKEAFENHAADILKIMQDENVPARAAVELFDLRHRNARLAQSAAGSAEQQARAKAQAEELERRARIPTSSRSVDAVNPLAGITDDMDDFSFIDRLVANTNQ